MHDFKQRLLCPKCTRVPIEGTPFVQVQECNDCEQKRERNDTVRGVKFVANVKQVGESMSEQGVSGTPGSTLRSPSGEARDDRALARMLGLKTLAKMPFLEYCRYIDPETNVMCAQPIKTASRIPKEKSESTFILGLSLRRCPDHLKQLSQEYMAQYMKVYLPKYMETYPREKRLESLKKSNAKRYKTPEHKAYMKDYLKKWRAKRREQRGEDGRVAEPGAEQIQTPTIQLNNGRASVGA